MIYPMRVEKKSYEALSCHLGEINRIVTSPNGRYVFSCGMDGILMIYQVIF